VDGRKQDPGQRIRRDLRHHTENRVTGRKKGEREGLLPRPFRTGFNLLLEGVNAKEYREQDINKKHNISQVEGRGTNGADRKIRGVDSSYSLSDKGTKGVRP